MNKPAHSLAGAGGTADQACPRSPGLQLIDADAASPGRSRYRANSYAPGTGAFGSGSASPSPSSTTSLGGVDMRRARDTQYPGRGLGAVATSTNSWQCTGSGVSPVGALVFYGVGKGAGHVAVSTENGQEIATLGYVGDRYPASQYAVVGSLS